MTIDVRGWRALVTGASSGLGVDFSRQLAELGCNLVLVARRRERLERLAAEIRQAHGVEVTVMDIDLSKPDAPQELFEDVAEEAGQHVDILVNNAGFGIYGRFAETPWDREADMLQLDVVALVHLTKLFLGPMIEEGRGRIMQIASIGAFQPSPGYASYSASKAFVLSFGEAINHELGGSGISCTVVSPGVTETEFLEVSGQEKGWFHRLTMMDSATVARMGIRAMLAGKPSVVTGWANYLNTLLVRVVPRRLATSMSAFVMKSR